MKVREVMTTNVGCCSPRTNAATIAEICWNRSCGVVPIVDDKNKILGVVTDRDLFIALGTRNLRPSELVAEEVMTKDVATCSPDEDVKQALAIMQARKVRRIPVVDKDKTVKGILSLHDVVRCGGDSTYPAIMTVMTRLCEQKPSAPAPITALVKIHA
jgi:CBS domain-containing protein